MRSALRLHRPLVIALTTVVALASLARAQATLPGAFQDQLVLGGLDQPIAMAQLPDGRLLVLEQKSARLRLIVDGAIATTDPVGVIDGVEFAGTEQGALGLAVDPGWPARPYLYVHCDDASGPYVRISRYTLSGDLGDPHGGTLVLSTASRYDLVSDVPDNASNHNGGTLRFGTDGMLFASFGEDADACGAQDLSLLKGTILRLDVSRLPAGPGAASRALVTAPGNPYAASADSNQRLLWAKGLRNPFRFTVDASDGSLFIADVGENSWEEVDHATAGGMNFGWPIWEADAPYLSCPSALPSPVSPIYAYDHGQGRAVVAGVVYRAPVGVAGRFPPEFQGRFFLSDYYSGWMWLLRDTGSGWAVVPGVDAVHWASGLGAVSDYLTGADGALWYCRQSVSYAPNTGAIRRITASSDTTGSVPPGNQVDFGLPYPSPARDATTFRYRMTASSRVDLRIFDARGRLTRTLRAGADVAAPGEQVVWDGTDDRGRRVPAGLYVARLEIGTRVLSRRFVMLR